MAAPCSEDRRMRRRLLPMVMPKPRSSGSHENLPYSGDSVSRSTSSVRGRIRSRQFLVAYAGRLLCVDVAILDPPAFLLRVQLDDELLADRHREVLAVRVSLHAALEVFLVDLEPLRDPAPLDARQRVDDARDLAARLLDLDHVARAHQVRRDVDLAAVDAEVTVPGELARLGVIGGESHPVDDVVQPALEQDEQVVAGHSLHAQGLVVVTTELALGNPVDALDLLLLAQLLAIVGLLAATRLSVLTRCVGAPLDATLVGVAAVAFQEQLHLFAPAQPADRANIASHLKLSVVSAGGSRCGESA